VRVSVVIATKGRPASLGGTLQSVARCDPGPDELIVVDGDEARSGKAVTEELARDDPGFTVRYVAAPAGLTRQRNIGLTEASGDIVVFFDDDIEADAALFGVVREAFEDPSVVGATGKITEDYAHAVGGVGSRARSLLLGGPDGTMTPFGYPRRIQDANAERDVEFMDGCFMSARRELALRLRFDEAMNGYALAEDEDFSYRLSRVGRIRYDPRAAIHHRTLGVSSARSREFNKTLVVNRAYLFRKNFRRTLVTRAQFGLLVATLAVHRALNRDWPGLRGVVEGAVEAWRRP